LLRVKALSSAHSFFIIKRYDDYAQVVKEEGVKIVETAGSNPKKWITLFKEADIKTIHKCVTIRHALSAQV
jgi:NADH:quinone reductase (non-electrogenic)